MRLALILLSFLLPRPTTYTDLAMGTVVEITLWEDGEVARLGFEEIKRIEDKFRIYKPDSDSETEYLIQVSFRYNNITSGAFDIDYRHDGKYDFGGIGKGYAVDRVAKIFKENGVKRAMINLGGNLYLIGYPPWKNYWTVGIKDPKEPDRLIGRIRLDKELGVATSGDYERPGHIINPKTGKSPDYVLSVTIVAPTATGADALSTGVFVLGREKGAELIEKLPEVEGVIIDKDGVWVSSGLKDKYEGLY